MANRAHVGRHLLAGAGLLALLMLSSSCSSTDPQNTLAPQGHIANVIQGLFYPVFWVAVAVFVLVEGLLLFAMVRFRERPGAEMPVQLHGNTRLEIGWTVAPTVILSVVGIFTIATLIHINTTPANAMQVNVIAHQWWWEFDYPDHNIKTADELHIPAGVPIHVTLHSADVVHSFWVPTLAGKEDVIPNHDNTMWLNAYQPGTYSAQCAQFCGEQHALMQFRVVAQSQDDFNAWVSDQTSSASMASAGAQLFLKGQCVACHTIDGTAAQGTVGPNLTHFASRAWFEEMDNTPDNVSSWLSSAGSSQQPIKHGNDMKINSLSDQDISSLVDFLESLK